VTSTQVVRLRLWSPLSAGAIETTHIKCHSQVPRALLPPMSSSIKLQNHALVGELVFQIRVKDRSPSSHAEFSFSASDITTSSQSFAFWVCI
jgi:hypothetical protein